MIRPSIQEAHWWHSEIWLSKSFQGNPQVVCRLSQRFKVSYESKGLNATFSEKNKALVREDSGMMVVNTPWGRVALGGVPLDSYECFLSTWRTWFTEKCGEAWAYEVASFAVVSLVRFHGTQWSKNWLVVYVQGCFNTPLEHTPKPLATSYNGIPFIVGQGDCLGCALGVCCNFLGLCCFICTETPMNPWVQWKTTPNERTLFCWRDPFFTEPWLWEEG